MRGATSTIPGAGQLCENSLPLCPDATGEFNLVPVSLPQLCPVMSPHVTGSCVCEAVFGTQIIVKDRTGEGLRGLRGREGEAEQGDA